MKKRWIFWDWNGTLQNDVAAAVAGTNAILRDQGKAEITADRYRSVFSFPARDCYDALGIEVTPGNWPQLCDRFFGVFSSDSSVGLFPGALAALQTFADAAFGQAIVSSCEISALEDALRRYGIRHFFADVVGRTDAAAGSKTDAAKALFDRVGAEAAGTWVVGDTGHDKEVADAIGCNCVLVASGYESLDRLRSRGAPVAENVAGVPALILGR